MAAPIETGAGPLRELFAFDKRVDIDDGAGNVVGQFAEQFRAYAGKTSLVGGESVMASRLAGTQPWIITVRYDARSATVTSDWRARDVRSGKRYAIRSAIERDRRYVDILAVEGVADTEGESIETYTDFSLPGDSMYLALV